MRKLLSFFIITALIACNSFQKPEKPDNLIPKDKMADIMYDVFILNAAKGASKSVLENHGIFPEDYVFKKHNIDSLQFALSTEYYGFQVEDYESIIAKVEEKINSEKAIYQKAIEQEEKDKERQKDSLNKLRDSLRLKKTAKVRLSD